MLWVKDNILKKDTCNLLILREKKLYSLQTTKLFKLACKIYVNHQPSWQQNIFALSTNNSILIDGLRTRIESFMNIINNKGPKWEPWGTLDKTGKSVERWKDILTACVWLK